MGVDIYIEGERRWLPGRPVFYERDRVGVDGVLDVVTLVNGREWNLVTPRREYRLILSARVASMKNRARRDWGLNSPREFIEWSVK
jgi:hypothetical protein